MLLDTPWGTTEGPSDGGKESDEVAAREVAGSGPTEGEVMDRRDWDERYRSEGFVWSERPNRFLEAETAGLPPGRAVDLACGEGRNAVWLAEQGWQVTGVDFSSVGLEKGRHLADRRGVEIEWVEASLEDWRPPPDGFDLVAVCYLQLAEPARRAALQKAAAAVAPGGTLLVVAHDEENLTAGVGGPQDAQRALPRRRRDRGGRRDGVGRRARRAGAPARRDRRGREGRNRRARPRASTSPRRTDRHAAGRQLLNESVPARRIPDACSVLAVCAHPDDESFGLGAVLSAFAEQGTTTSVLSFTRGESSTLGAEAGDLTVRRSEELVRAANELGVTTTRLFDHPDGQLDRVPADELTREVEELVGLVGSDLLLVFDVEGVTGHSDHIRATQIALATAERLALPVLAWSLGAEVASRLNAEFGTAFVGCPGSAIDFDILVDRDRQLRAVGCHVSQSSDNPVLWRRLELQGSRELLRWVRP